MPGGFSLKFNRRPREPAAGAERLQRRVNATRVYCRLRYMPPYTSTPVVIVILLLLLLLSLLRSRRLDYYSRRSAARHRRVRAYRPHARSCSTSSAPSKFADYYVYISSLSSGKLQYPFARPPACSRPPRRARFIHSKLVSARTSRTTRRRTI